MSEHLSNGVSRMLTFVIFTPWAQLAALNVVAAPSLACRVTASFTLQPFLGGLSACYFFMSELLHSLFHMTDFVHSIATPRHSWSGRHQPSCSFSFVSFTPQCFVSSYYMIGAVWHLERLVAWLWRLFFFHRSFRSHQPFVSECSVVSFGTCPCFPQVLLPSCISVQFVLSLFVFSIFHVFGHFPWSLFSVKQKTEPLFYPARLCFSLLFLIWMFLLGFLCFSSVCHVFLCVS